MKSIIISLGIFLSVISFNSSATAFSDYKIKKEAEKIVIQGLRKIGVKDLINKKTKVIEIKQNTRNDGICFVFVELSIHSKKHGPGFSSTYLVFNKRGEIIENKYRVVTIDEVNNGYLNTRAEYKALAEYFGDENAFFIVDASNHKKK